jgi:hypothetical protein
MQKTIDPRIAIAVVLAIVVIAVVGYVVSSKGAAPVDATKAYSKEVLADPDPPHHPKGRD